MELALTNEDRKQIKDLGIEEEYIQWQIEMFKKGTPYVKLLRPCTIGDGIIRLSDKEVQELVQVYKDKTANIKKIKFVPASGAATRMFKALVRFYYEGADLKKIKKLASQGDQDARDMWVFVSNIKRFAFYEDLKSVLKKEGLDAEKLIMENKVDRVLHYLLTEDGLNYANLPKALIKFHNYPDGSRTAFEEQLVEAWGYIAGQDGCHLHFTVSPEHKERFIQFFEKVRNRYEGRYCTRYDVEFSLQDRSTDTIAVDLNNRPFRTKDGRLLFRPGGHGALLDNLNTIDGDVIFIKNIDNVVPDRLKQHIYLWKRALAGYLLKIRDRVNGSIRALKKGADENTLQRIEAFCKEYLCLEIPQNLGKAQRIEYIIDHLNRPLRVCGMVRNVKEPGGGPFWIKDPEGNVSLQIVESAQVDMSSEEQRDIFDSSTHFNPVDIVCWVKDWQGNRFDLKKYVDTNAVFITTKSKDGKELKALELPGLWNGGMAYWNSIFIEVPFITFNPVKKVVDLLRENHQ